MVSRSGFSFVFLLFLFGGVWALGPSPLFGPTRGVSFLPGLLRVLAAAGARTFRAKASAFGAPWPATPLDLGVAGLASLQPGS